MGDVLFSPAFADEVDDLVSGQAEVDAIDIKWRGCFFIRTDDENLSIFTFYLNFAFLNGLVKQGSQVLPGV